MTSLPHSQFAGYETVFIPNPIKNRVSYNFKKCFYVTQNIFTNIFDLETQIINCSPDLLHIHLEENLEALPWRDLLLNLRRKIPHMLVSIWHKGTLIDKRILDLYFYVDHVFIGNQEAINQYWDKHLLRASFWAPMSNSHAEILSLVDNTRQVFLRNQYGDLIDITIFIGTYNRLDKLKLSVNSVISSSDKHKIEIIIHDAGSTDGTQEWLRSLNCENVFVIYAGKRTSFTQVFNETLQIAKGKYICWFSDDIVAEGNALNDMYDVMEGINPTDIGGFYIMNSVGARGERIEYIARSFEGFYWPTVGFMYTETLRKLNGLNMDYPFYSQDTDLDMRVLRIGGSIYMVPHCRLFHCCRNDELRHSNIEKHENMMTDIKYNLGGWYPNKVSQFQYPTILFMLKEGGNIENIKKTISNIKKHYLNSHMFINLGSQALDISEIKNLKEVIDGAQVFDIIIEVGDTNRLLCPAQFTNELFTKILLG